MEVYLSCNESNLQTAVHLKEDIEQYTSLFVALETEDWEDIEDFEFQDQIHEAEVLLNLKSESSSITAWLIDEKKHYSDNKSPPTHISVAPTINITNSYKAGFETLLGLIAQNMDRNDSLHYIK